MKRRIAALLPQKPVVVGIPKDHSERGGGAAKENLFNFLNCVFVPFDC